MRVRFNNLYLQNKIVYNDYIKSLKKTIKESFLSMVKKFYCLRKILKN